MITHHTQLIQALIDKHNLKSYLEIGVQNPANNFDKIICQYKQGCDPDMSMPDARSGSKIMRLESDEYFKMQFHKKKWDLIFLDGLHTADQVKRDFDNSLACLSDNGFILIHDCLPENEEGTLVPRQTKRWWGSVYKFCMNLAVYDGIRYVTYNIDEGCMLIWKDKTAIGRNFIINPDWKTYESNGKVFLNVVDEVII